MANDNSKELNKNDEFLIKQKCQQLRNSVLKSLYCAKSGHPGGSLSCLEILFVLYNYILGITPDNLSIIDRNHFILSKGHAVPAMYAVLSDLGFFEESIYTLRNINSPLQGHPDRFKTPGIECDTGSLGMGISVGIGMCLHLFKIHSSSRVFVLVGDGELQEGSCWEAIMAAGHFRLSNLVLIMDRNKIQLDGSTESILSLEPIIDKFFAFNWSVEKVNGHSIKELYYSFNKSNENSLPLCIVAETIKGHGIEAFENNSDWHSIRNFDDFEIILKKNNVI